MVIPERSETSINILKDWEKNGRYIELDELAKLEIIIHDFKKALQELNINIAEAKESGLIPIFNDSSYVNIKYDEKTFLKLLGIYQDHAIDIQHDINIDMKYREYLLKKQAELYFKFSPITTCDVEYTPILGWDGNRFYIVLKMMGSLYLKGYKFNCIYSYKEVNITHWALLDSSDLIMWEN